MSDILVELEKGTGDQSLSLVIPLPDSVHVSESLKAGFATGTWSSKTRGSIWQFSKL